MIKNSKVEINKTPVDGVGIPCDSITNGEPTNKNTPTEEKSVEKLASLSSLLEDKYESYDSTK